MMLRVKMAGHLNLSTGESTILKAKGVGNGILSAT